MVDRGNGADECDHVIEDFVGAVNVKCYGFVLPIVELIVLFPKASVKREQSTLSYSAVRNMPSGVLMNSKKASSVSEGYTVLP